jgi:hypothetical protein
MSVFYEWCVLSSTGLLRRANYTSSGVLPSVVLRYVLSRNLVNEEALAQWGLLSKIKKNLNAKYDNRYITLILLMW